MNRRFIASERRFFDQSTAARVEQAPTPSRESGEGNSTIHPLRADQFPAIADTFDLRVPMLRVKPPRFSRQLHSMFVALRFRRLFGEKFRYPIAGAALTKLCESSQLSSTKL